MPRIQSLYIYPVKSCRGIAVERATVTERGFEHDREWMIVDADSLRFLTQREEPRLALIETRLDAGALTLTAPGVGSVAIDVTAEGAPVEVLCWRDRCAAFDLGSQPAQWLSDFLGRRMRLVRFAPHHRRASDPSWTNDVEALNKFSDGFPWLVLSQASLDDLNRRLPAPLPVNRFRPNIVLGDVPAFAEDRIHELDWDGVRLRLVKPCTRCAITTTDQSTGERQSDEPLRTLRSFRFSKKPMGVLFGQNAILLAGAGRELSIEQRATAAWKEPA
jgi:uncharacterized protein YcbX